MTIIDVSEWQGVINWNKAKPHIDGVILRCGCGTSYDDKQWARNVRECERLGTTDIDLSGYVLSTDLVEATTTEIDTILAS